MNNVAPLALDSPSQRAAALAVLKQAFLSHPIMPAGSPPEATGALLELLLDTFGNTDTAWLHGIRLDGHLACVAFSYDAHVTPSLPALLRFVIRLAAILGWRQTSRFLLLFLKRPRHKQRYLELLLLGTAPAHHGQGLGRSMMHFLYDFASRKGFDGVLLDVARETPAYNFYVKEGFATDKKQTMNGQRLCHMRRERYHKVSTPNSP